MWWIRREGTDVEEVEEVKEVKEVEEGPALIWKPW